MPGAPAVYGGDSDGQIRICSWHPCDVDCIRRGSLLGCRMVPVIPGPLRKKGEYVVVLRCSANTRLSITGYSSEPNNIIKSHSIAGRDKVEF